MKLPAYLQRNRFGVFYFRRAVPLALRPHIGKCEILRSLRTRDRRLALWQGRALALQVESWFLSVETAMARKRSGSGTLRTELKIEVETFGDGTTKKTVTFEPGDIEAMSPEQMSVFMHGPTGTITAPAVSLTATPTATSATDPRLSELIEKFYDDKRGEAAEDDGAWEVPDGYRTKFRRLTEILGDVPCRKVTRESAKYVRAQLKKLPADTSKFRNMSVAQMIATNPTETLSPKTLKDHITLYSSLFLFARRERLYADENPFDGLRVADSMRNKDRRDIFTDDDLTRIFSGHVFTDYGKNPYDAPCRYWAPLIALFTGARLAEIAGLHLDDIGTQDDFAYIDINLNTDKKRVKTANSIRKVPLHPTLIELGLLNYRDALKARGEERLFPELTTYSKEEGYGRNIGDWFNRTYLPERGVYVKRKKTFHSFRHTLATRLERAGVPTRVIDQLSGRTTGTKSVGEEFYIKDRDLADLANVVREKLDFSACLAKLKAFTT